VEVVLWLWVQGFLTMARLYWVVVVRLTLDLFDLKSFELK